MTGHEVGALVNALRSKALVVEDLPKIDTSPDPDDNPILATAIAGEAQYLVSRDKRDVLDLQVVAGVRILIDLFIKISSQLGRPFSIILDGIEKLEPRFRVKKTIVTWL